MVIQLSYFTCIYLVVKPLSGTKVKVSCESQAQISRSFNKNKKKKKKKKKMVLKMALVFHKHILFHFIFNPVKHNLHYLSHLNPFPNKPWFLRVPPPPPFFFFTVKVISWRSVTHVCFQAFSHQC